MRGLVFGMMLALVAGSAAAQEDGFEPVDGQRLEACIGDATAYIGNTSGDGRRAGDCIGVAAKACQMDAPGNQSPQGMARCTRRETAWWDARLNASYARLREMLHPDLFAKLRQTQRAWIAFRDADCGFDYAFWQEGTIRHLFYTSCQLQATAERAIGLDEILDWMDV